MAESVNILIQAEDRATPKIQAAVKSMDSMADRVKDVGGKTKATTELVGTFANSLGGTALGQFAGELAGLTERISAFSEVSKQGGAGALALRAGIYAAAAIVTYKIADGIAEWYFEAAKWRREMEAADKAAQKASQSLAGVRQKAFSQGREDVELVRNPQDREAAAQARAEELDNQAASLEQKIAEQRRKVAQAQQQVDNANPLFGNREAESELKAQQQLLDDLSNMQDEYRNEADAMREAHGERAKRIAQIKEENARADRSDQFIQGLKDEVEWLKATEEERRKLDAARNTIAADTGEAERLMKERDALKAKEQDEQKAEQRRQAAIDLEKKENEALKEKEILLNQGAEAARAYRLQQQGLSEEAAKEIAAREALLDKQLEGKNKPKEDQKSTQPSAEPIAATQGRLMTRGSGNPNARLIQVAERQAKLQEDATRLLAEILAATGSSSPVTLQVAEGV